MRPQDANDLLQALAEEATRLRDPAELQFVGGDPDADARSAAALTAQLEGVPALRAQAPVLAEASGREVDDVLAVVRGYADATTEALERVRAGRAPEAERRVQHAPRDAEPASTVGGGAGMGSNEPTRPSLGLPVLVAVVVLVVAVVVVALLL